MVRKIWDERGSIALAHALFIVVLLPLYTRGGFFMIGDVKYYFYRNCSFFFLAVTIVLASFHLNEINFTKLKQPDGTDLWIAVFGLAGILSWAFSAYKRTAFYGVDDWHMGLLTQFLLIFGYYLAKCWVREKKKVYVAAAITGAIVSLLAVLNRCGDDPLRFYEGMGWFDWNRRNLLATIGNINWLCAYLSVSVPVLLFFFWHLDGWKRILAFAGAFFGVAAFVLQGSSVGILDLAVVLLVLFFASLGDGKKLVRFVDTLILVPLFWFVFSFFQFDLLLPDELDIQGRFYSIYWIVPLFLLAMTDFVLRVWVSKIEEGFWKRHILEKAAKILFFSALALFILVFLLCNVSDEAWELAGGRSFLRITEEWGSYRGFLWKKTVSGFAGAGIIQKLFGAGEDCFMSYMYSHADMELHTTGQWQYAVFANAHNEWLTMLVNEGILGLVSYLGIFVTTLASLKKRAGRDPFAVLGILLVITYMVNDTFGFQQVISTPQIFLLMGLEKERKNEGEVKGETEGNRFKIK